MAAKKDARRYKWFEYKGKRIRAALKDVEMTFIKGQLFGLRIVGNKHYIVDINLENQLLLPADVANRMIANSKGFSGKLGKVVVKAGVGGLDTLDRKSGDVRIDSSMFIRGKYSVKDKTLTLEFRSRAVWQYKDVTPKEVMAFERAKSQGRWYNDNIKAVKEGQRLQPHKFESHSSAAPRQYRIHDLPDYSAEHTMESAFALGQHVDLFLAGDSFKLNKRIHNCVIGGVHHYPGKVAYDLYVPDGLVEEQLTSDTPIHHVRVYTLLTNVDSNCVLTHTPEDGVSESSADTALLHSLYELNDLPHPFDVRAADHFLQGDRVSLYLKGQSPIHWCVVCESERVGEEYFYTLFVPISSGCNYYSKVFKVPNHALERINSAHWPKSPTPFEVVPKQ